VNDSVNPSARPAQHPLDIDLVAWIDGSLNEGLAHTVEEHVAECRRCADLVAEVAGPLDGSSELEELPTATGFSLTGEVTAQPAIGEVWVLEWDDAAFLAVVTSGADTATVRVVPVTAEAPPDGEHSAPGEARFHAAAAEAVTVPLGVFRERVAADGAVEWTATTRPPSWTTALHWATSLAALEKSRHASWVPAVADGDSLADLVRARGLRPRDLADRTGLEPGAVTDLLRADRALTVDEAARLAEVLGVEASELMRVEIPPALAWAIERPTHRARIRRGAAESGRTEAEQRIIEAQAVMAVPARTTSRDRDVDTWDELLRHHLGS
jgi:plasmid maintenance system antidote protein VapI